MFAIPFGLYLTVLYYPGSSQIVLVHVTPALPLRHRYFPSVAPLMFDRYFPLMTAFHVDWLSRRHQFSSILASDVSASLVSPTRNMLALQLLCDNDSWDSSVVAYICKTACD